VTTLQAYSTLLLHHEKQIASHNRKNNIRAQGKKHETLGMRRRQKAVFCDRRRCGFSFFVVCTLCHPTPVSTKSKPKTKIKKPKTKQKQTTQKQKQKQKAQKQKNPKQKAQNKTQTKNSFTLPRGRCLASQHLLDLLDFVCISRFS
jgi:FKBP-type peptidyl-prolyl cis-trans isomerase